MNVLREKEMCHFSRMCSGGIAVSLVSPFAAKLLVWRELAAWLPWFIVLVSFPDSLPAPPVQLFIIISGLFAQPSLLLLQLCFGPDLLASRGLGWGSWQRLSPSFWRWEETETQVCVFWAKKGIHWATSFGAFLEHSPVTRVLCGVAPCFISP